MYRLKDAFPYLLNRVGVRMGELFSRRLADFGVTLPMYRVMAALWEAGDRGLGELSEVASIELSTLSRLVGSMANKGLVSRMRPDANARTVQINLTLKGRRLVEKLIPVAASYEEAGLRSFRAEEVAHLKGDLVKVYENLAELDRGCSQRASPSRPRKTTSRTGRMR